MRRRSTLKLIACTAISAWATHAAGQPTRAAPVRLLVGYPAGGQTDVIARLLAERLGEFLGAPVIVENRPGANGKIAAEAVARAPADGHMLLVGGAANLTIAPILDADARYDTLRDFVPIGRIARVPMFLVVRESLPVASGMQLLQFARRNPGKLVFASPSAHSQLAIESLKTAQGLDILVAPYKGSAQVTMDLVAGRVDFTMSDAATVDAHVRSGTLRVIASAGATRSQRHRDVPTMIEQGVPDFEWDTWQGLVAPRETPVEVLRRLQQALGRVREAAAFRDALEDLGFLAVEDTPEEFSLLLRAELKRNRDLAKRIEPRAGK